MNTKPIQFIRRGKVVSLANVPPTRMLLQVLREDLNCTGSKEGCGEGDCGACTVVVGEAQGDGIKYSAINSCIRTAHSIDGMALFTVEDIAPTLHRSRGSLPPEGAHFVLGRPGDETIASQSLHPVQQAMVECHGSQCGFCTPGFVMSLFGTYQNRVCKGQPVTRQIAQEDLSGNLCRCTGYRPILDAAQTMGQFPPVRVNEPELLQQLKQLKPIPQGPDADFAYMLPQTLAELLTLRAGHPKAQIVAGCTDVGLWVNKMHMDFPQVLDVTQVGELRQIEQYRHHIAIGAAVSLTDAFAALVHNRPHLHTFATRFAGLPVRNSGTLGGNVANGSPIGDSMPLLIALGASVVLMRQRKGRPKGEYKHREMRLEDFYTGYRKNVLAADEVLAWIKVPKATLGEQSRVYKISKRFDDDISAVCLALNLSIDNGVVLSASVGAGGVAATPARARKTEAALTGQPWTPATVQQVQAILRAEFSPISDMRATRAYRTQVLGNLLQRFWLESRGHKGINLEDFDIDLDMQGLDLEGAPA